MSWFSDAARDAINKARASESAVPGGYNYNNVYAPATSTPSSTTFTNPAYAPGTMDQFNRPVWNEQTQTWTNQQVTPRGVDWWASQMQSRAQHLTPYRYPMPPPPVVAKPTYYDADNPKFKPAWEVDNGKWAAVYDGVAHDFIASQPVGADERVLMDGGYDAPMFRRVYADSDGSNAKTEFGKLSMFEKLAWKNAAEALGGGARNDESTFAKYFARAADASRTGVDGGPAVMTTAWQLLMEDIRSGYLPNVLPGEFKSDEDSSGGGGGFGGGGGGGGDTSVNLMNVNDARAVINAMASQMLGRTVTEKEFQSYYKTLLQLQKDNPQVVTMGEDGTVEVSQSIGNEGLQYALEAEMRQDEDFAINSVGTQAMGLLQEFVQSRMV